MTVEDGLNPPLRLRFRAEKNISRRRVLVPGSVPPALLGLHEDIYATAYDDVDFCIGVRLSELSICLEVFRI